MNNRFIRSILFAAAVCFAFVESLKAQQQLSYGNMDQWITRQIKESLIIGGKTKEIYAIGPTQVIEGDIAYTNKGGSPWASSNVMAKVKGITKTNCSVYPEKRGNGYCARLETRIEKVKVLGLINLKVLAAGSVFLGSVHEPIKSTNNPDQILNVGIPFTSRPTALKFDYRVKLSGKSNSVKATGFGSMKTINRMDKPIVVLMLQKRWEDKAGNIYAKRVGTMVVEYSRSTAGWVNGATYNILYGDITGNPSYNASTMGLLNGLNYTVNSKGRIAPIREVAWADKNERPTHLCLQFASSNGGAYIGSPGNTLWIDNVMFTY